jgi:hypothetical protein
MAVEFEVYCRKIAQIPSSGTLALHSSAAVWNFAILKEGLQGNVVATTFVAGQFF